MEILIYYIIAALSFAIMYSINYSWEIAQTVIETLYIFDMDYTDSDWNPYMYLAVGFMLTLVLMPMYIPAIFGKRYERIKDASAYILVEEYGFIKEDDSED